MSNETPNDAPTEIGQPVVVHRHVAAYPLVGRVRRSKPGQFPRAASAFERGRQPQGQQSFRIGGPRAGMTFDRANLLVNRLEIQTFDVLRTG